MKICVWSSYLVGWFSTLNKSVCFAFFPFSFFFFSPSLNVYLVENPWLYVSYKSAALNAEHMTQRGWLLWQLIAREARNTWIAMVYKYHKCWRLRNKLSLYHVTPVDCFQQPALFQQVFIVPWKNAEICIVKLVYLEIVDFNETKGATRNFNFPRFLISVLVAWYLRYRYEFFLFSSQEFDEFEEFSLLIRTSDIVQIFNFFLRHNVSCWFND